jgi:hypothetical protein
MTDRRIPGGIAGDLMLALGVVAWSIGYIIGRAIGFIERWIRGPS